MTFPLIGKPRVAIFATRMEAVMILLLSLLAATSTGDGYDLPNTSHVATQTGVNPRYSSLEVRPSSGSFIIAAPAGDRPNDSKMPTALRVGLSVVLDGLLRSVSASRSETRP